MSPLSAFDKRIQAIRQQQQLHVRMGDQELLDQLSFLRRAVAGYHVNFFAVRLRSYDVDEKPQRILQRYTAGPFSQY